MGVRVWMAEVVMEVWGGCEGGGGGEGVGGWCGGGGGGGGA